MIHADIFKAYDIRGIVGQSLTERMTWIIGRAIAIEAKKQGILHIVVGRDGRLSSPALSHQLILGLQAEGVNALNVGMVTTPMLYFAAIHHCHGSGIMVTGSHNPPEYNGFKIMLAGKTLAGAAIQQLKQRALTLSTKPNQISLASNQTIDITTKYIDTICQDIRLKRNMNIVIDAGNGVAGLVAGRLFRQLGCTVTELFAEVDGTFPHHHPDPSKPENLQTLMQTLKQQNADIGLAFDGDGDRLGVVSPMRRIVYPDRLLMFFAQSLLAKHPQSPIIFDVKCSRLLKNWIQQLGGQAIMSRTGHSYIKAAMQEHHALLAGEMSGHLFFHDRWLGFDDGVYAGARLLEILSGSQQTIDALLDCLPQNYATPEINLPLPQEIDGHQLIQQLSTSINFPDAVEIITIDGIRVEFNDGFGLIRSSNTTPVLVLRFEADSLQALKRIQQRFYYWLKQHSQLTPFSVIELSKVMQNAMIQ